MNAYVLSNMRHETVGIMSILSERIMRANNNSAEYIELTICDAERIRDCLCDSNNLMTEILKKTDISFFKNDSLPF